MSISETVISGYGMEISKKIKVGYDDDREYYEEYGCDIWDVDFEKHGLKVHVGEFKTYVGLFEITTENLNFGFMHYHHEYKFIEICAKFEETKQKFYNLFKEYPFLKPDDVSVKLLHLNLYS